MKNIVNYGGNSVKLIMENWRKWLGLEEDPPSDGMEPIDPKAYDVHPGGADSQLPTLNPPDEHPRGAPIKDRPALQIDHPKGAPSDWSMNKLDRNIQDFRKSDRDFNMPTNKDLIQRMNVQNRELTRLEAADTILKYDADRQREMMEEFKEVLAQADTVDIDLFHIHKELNDMENSIRALKTRR